MFEELEHTADYAIRAWGKNLPELFIEAARGMNSLTGGKPGSPSSSRRIKLEAPDLETLLISWIEELAYYMEVESMIFSDLKISNLSPHVLQATVTGGPAVGLSKLIKAITYHHLEIQEVAGGYETTIVFDV